MTLGSRCSLVFVLGALSGCATVTVRQTNASADLEAAVVAANCSGERWIGLLPERNRTCPARWSPLFEIPPPRPASPAAGFRPSLDQLADWAREGGLDRFCLYRSATGRPPSMAGFDRVDRDCRGVSGQQLQGLIAASGPALAQSTLDAIALPPATPAAARVRLAVLDTEPVQGGGGTPSCSHHGRTLGQLARQVACRNRKGKDCPVSVHYRLALGAQTQLGCTGPYGWISDVAVALFDELKAWSQDPSDPAPDRLVINLSLGWDGRLFGGFEEKRWMPAQARAVYQTLELARKARVLVVAAAGNATPGPNSPTGPLLPAAWEAVGRHQPVVFAVNGLTSNSRSLVSTRPGALAPRAAFGGPAVVRDDQQLLTPALTGSSVGSVVVAGLAAAHWARTPADPPAHLVETLENLGKPLEWLADPALDRDRPQSRHIGPGRSTSLTSKPWQGASTTTLTLIPATKISPSALSLFYQAESSPQPSSDPCPNCTVDPPSGSSRTQSATSTLWIELNPEWDWQKHPCVRLAALEIQSGTYQAFFSTAGAVPLCGPGTVYRLDLAIPSTFDQAMLHWEALDILGMVVGTAVSVPVVTRVP